MKNWSAIALCCGVTDSECSQINGVLAYRGLGLEMTKPIQVLCSSALTELIPQESCGWQEQCGPLSTVTMSDRFALAESVSAGHTTGFNEGSPETPMEFSGYHPINHGPRRGNIKILGRSVYLPVVQTTVKRSGAA